MMGVKEKYLRFFLRLLGGRGKYVYLLLILLLTGAAGYFASGLTIDQSNQAMNAEVGNYREVFDKLNNLFGNVETIVVGVQHPNVLSYEGMTFIDTITNEIGAIPDVNQVRSLTNATTFAWVAGELVEKPLVDRSSLQAGHQESVRASLKANPQLQSWLLSPDQQTAGLIVAMENYPGDEQYQGRIIAALRQLAQRHTRPDIHFYISGLSVQKNDVGASVRRDQAILFPLSILVMTLILLFMFRGVVGVLLPFLVTGISITWTLGFYAFCGYSLNIITSLLPPVVIVLSLATSIHLMHVWLEERASGETTLHRAKMLAPCFFTAGTTALGFISLYTSDLPAVRQFGLFSAFGVMVAFAVGMTLVPLCLLIFPVPLPAMAYKREGRMGCVLRQCADLSIRYPRLWLLVVMIPNVAPLIFGGGVMGFLGIDLSTGTAMIASVVLGMAVDDTIHYLARFRLEYSMGRDVAIRRTTTATGKALVITTVVLVLGFWVGCLGSFKPTIYFSWLTGVTLIMALICDLLVLPACLTLMYPQKRTLHEDR